MDLPLLNPTRHYGFTLLGNEPAHIMGGLLDHVYIRNNVNFFDKVTLENQPVCFSDQDAIILNRSIHCVCNSKLLFIVLLLFICSLFLTFQKNPWQ